MPDQARSFRFGWKPEFPDHRDHPYASMRMALEAPVALPVNVDLRRKCPPVYDQGDLGSCTANAIAGAFEFDRLAQNLPDFVPSRLFIYWNERDMEGTVDEDAGAYIRDGIKTVAALGVCKEDLWPYDIARFRTKPTPACYTQAQRYLSVDYYRLDNSRIFELKSCLAAGFPFVFGFTVFNSFFQANTNGGFVPMPSNEQAVGGHAVLCVGYDDAKGHFIVRNSWGDAYGDKGYYYFPYAYLSPSLSNDFWTIRTVTTAALPKP
ncbi:MAG: C1 family peptidase [Novosphingobium sp.]